jgi:hypothetical protein
MTDPEASVQDTLLGKVFSWIVAIATAAFSIAILYAILQIGATGFWDHIAQKHMVSVIGLPCAAIASLILVLMLRTIAGKIEIKVL